MAFTFVGIHTRRGTEILAESGRDSPATLG
jgi:hypothetical protein